MSEHNCTKPQAIVHCLNDYGHDAELKGYCVWCQAGTYRWIDAVFVKAASEIEAMSAAVAKCGRIRKWPPDKDPIKARGLAAMTPQQLLGWNAGKIHT